jgi:hypothetical protein
MVMKILVWGRNCITKCYSNNVILLVLLPTFWTEEFLISLCPPIKLLRFPISELVLLDSHGALLP